MKNKKEKMPNAIKLQIGLIFLLTFRVCASILFSDLIYPNTNNLIEAIFFDLSPLMIVFLLMAISSSVYQRTLHIFKVFSSEDKTIEMSFYIPAGIILAFVFLPERSTFANMFEQDKIVTPMMNITVLAQVILDAENFLCGKIFLGYNALEFVKTLFLVGVFACIAYSILKLLLKFYQISIANTRIKVTNALKVELLLFSLLILIFNMTALFYVTITVYPQIFSDCTVSSNSLMKLFDALYLAVTHLFNIGVKEPVDFFGKLLVMTIPIINLSFFTVFISAVFNKEPEKEKILIQMNPPKKASGHKRYKKKRKRRR